MNFLLALAANTCFYFGFQALFPTLPLYIEHLGGGPTDNGLVTFVFAAAAVLSRAFVGDLTDRWGRKFTMLAGAAIFVLAPLGYAASRTIAAILAIRAMQGVGMAAFTTAYQALIIDLSPPERRGQSLGLSANAMALAMVTGPLAGDAVMTQFGFTPLFILSAASAALCALLVMCARLPELQHHTSSEFLLRKVITQPGLAAVLIGMSVIGLVFGVFVTFTPLYVQEAGLGAPGMSFTVYALALLVIQIGAGRLSDHIGRARVAAPALLLVGVFMLVLSQARAAWMGWGAVFLYGLAAGAARIALDGMLADNAPPRQRATAIAVQFAIHDTWIGLGGALLGPVAQAAGYSAMYVLVGVGVIIGALFFVLAAKQQTLAAE